MASVKNGRHTCGKMMGALSDRLRRVRICCGDWNRVCGPGPTIHNGLTAVFLDPPYDLTERADDCYAVDKPGVSGDVRKWAIESGEDPRMRIALCGYDTEHNMLEIPRRLWWPKQRARTGERCKGDGVVQPPLPGREKS
jgi:hypothetical protein